MVVKWSLLLFLHFNLHTASTFGSCIFCLFILNSLLKTELDRNSIAFALLHFFFRSSIVLNVIAWTAQTFQHPQNEGEKIVVFLLSCAPFDRVECYTTQTNLIISKVKRERKNDNAHQPRINNKISLPE